MTDRIPPKIMIHGGFANELDINAKTIEQKLLALIQIIDKAQNYYMQGHSTVDTAVYTAGLLEENPLFNAGLGSRIQQDGHIRQSASLMDGKSRKFASVINMEGVLHPSKVVQALWEQDSRKNTSLAPPGVNMYAQQLGHMPLDYNTQERVHEWEEVFLDSHADQARIDAGQTGTIGCVIAAPQEDGSVEMVAITSTGGTLKNNVGRVSDSSSPAGNFATKNIAISMTGNGEEIMNHAVASSIAALTDFTELSSEEAAKKVFESIEEFQAGAIIIDKDGNMIATDSKPHMMWAKHNGHTIEVVSDNFEAGKAAGKNRQGEQVSEEMLERARNASFESVNAPLPQVASKSISMVKTVEDDIGTDKSARPI